MGKTLTAPESISLNHNLTQFNCGHSSLDSWLVKRALKNEVLQASRTFVIHQERRVIGYYALAAGSVSHDVATSRMTRNMPEPIPVVVLGRLAIDQEYQGQGLGRALLRDAILRTVQASELLGIKGMLVHALDQQAANFYRDCGFSKSPINDLTLMLPISEVEYILKDR